MGKTIKTTKASPLPKKAKVEPKPNDGPSKRERINRYLSRFDVAGHLAERLAPHYKIWWVPVSLFAFPALLLILAFLINSLRAG